MMKFTLTSMAFAVALITCASSDAKTQASTNLKESPNNPTANAAALTNATASREPQGLRNAAEQGLRTVITELTRDLKAGNLPNDFPIEINDLSELKSAKLGIGFEIHTIQPQTLLAGNRPMEQMVSGTGIWNFVITINNHPVALLEMEKTYGKWTVNGIGGAKLAQDVQSAAQTHSGKDAFRFVRIYQATADFMEVKDSNSKARYVPLIAARETLKMAPAPATNASNLSDGSDLLPSLQNTVRANIARLPR